MKDERCPCLSGVPYPECCRPYLEGRKNPPSPEPLMRSRFTAFCNGRTDYLLATLAPEKRAGQEARLRLELERTMARTRWLGLEVLDRGKEGVDRGWVEFAAFFEQDGTLGQLHERSAFIRADGMWYYLDGEILPPVKLSRNRPCICGSGLKFKRCHGKGL